jgi:hypothetical protein
LFTFGLVECCLLVPVTLADGDTKLPLATDDNGPADKPSSWLAM